MAKEKVVKRGRGRPRKKKPIPEVKRERGRPRKNPLPIETATPKKRGRPKKNKFVVRDQEENVNTTPVKVGKLVGYCPDCLRGLCSLDHISNIDPEDKMQDVYHCYHCRKDVKQSKLMEDRPEENIPKYKTKREYLEDCLQIPDDEVMLRSNTGPINSASLVGFSSENEGDGEE